jgi:ATP-dependent DNA ligase
VDITGQTILERRALLERIIKPVPGIQLGTYVQNEGNALFQLVK